ncbi:MAG: hypothetical protein AAGA32_02685 [Pseudomonadota bacterium]
MAANDADYPGGQPTREVKLAALGFSGSGHRGGGISHLHVKTLPKGTVLLRFYKPVGAGENPGDFGAWWFTPHELRRICAYFGVDGRALIVGRSSGKSGLHGVLALLHEWYGGAPTQLSYVNAVKLTAPLWACYGPGAPANADGYARTMKPVRLADGAPARQVYIHQCWLYQSVMERLLPVNASTDAIFGSRAGLPPKIAAAARLAFEAA